MTAASDLAVDLDGTLLRTDTLVEGFFRALFHDPKAAFEAVLALRRGRSAVKAVLRDYSIEGIRTYPARDELVSWLAAEASGGRRLHLVTAAHQSVAEEAARRFEIFDHVIGTSETSNLKGAMKRGELGGRFGGGWSYAGDCRADLPIFLSAKSVVLAGHDPALHHLVSRSGAHIEASFPRARATLRDWLQALRLHQWAKNLLLFVPLLLSGAFFQPEAVAGAMAAFLLLGLCASGTYLLNDIADLASDRAHATKCNRPLAAGRIPLLTGFLTAIALVAGSLAVSFVALPEFGLLLAIYTITTITYSMSFKRLAMFDVSVLASLFTLRLAMGAVAAGVPLSGWLAAFSLTFFLSLSLAKRATEIQKAPASRQLVPGRGYRKSDYPLVLAFGVASGMTALLLMILFLVFQAFHQPTYHAPRFLLVTPLMTFLWLSRIWLLASRGELKDDPVVFAIKDRASLGLGAIMGIVTLLAVIGPEL